MHRREFNRILAGMGVAAAWSTMAVAQQSAKNWRIGFLAHRYEAFYAPLFRGLEELGYKEGRNLIVERRYAEGHAERFQEFADELVRLKVDLIVVVTTPAGMAAKRATSTIPIVHPAAIDPVGTGLVASLAHPGGNLTGLSVLNAEMSAKRLEVLREVVPGLATAALLWNSANPANSLAWNESESAARTLGVNLRSQEVREPRDFERAFKAMAENPPEVLLVLQDALTLEYRKEIIAFTLKAHLPSMFVGKEWVTEGGLMSYGDRLPERYRRAADLVDRILKGEKPADLPVEQPTKFELVLNLKTARAMNLNIPPTLLMRADEVIE
jgi:putative tryptophan/tyrosine transport system substrate-binding protein